MRTLLVTGGAGFIGSNFILRLRETSPKLRLINFDALTYAGRLSNLKDLEEGTHYRFIHADICDSDAVERVFNEENIDAVINFAAESHVDRSIEGPETFAMTNVLGAVTLLTAALRAWVGPDMGDKRFLQVSTDEVYGSLGETGAFTEDSPLNPRSPYSASKASADVFAKAYFDTYGLPVVITRCSNNYGPRQHAEKLIPKAIDCAVRGVPVPVYGDGKNVRDWLYVGDHCAALELALTKGSPGRVYNIGGKNELTNIELLNEIFRCVRARGGTVRDGGIQFVEDRKGHDRRYAIDPSRIEQELGWRPQVAFQDGIARTVAWYV